MVVFTWGFIATCLWIRRGQELRAAQRVLSKHHAWHLRERDAHWLVVDPALDEEQVMRTIVSNMPGVEFVCDPLEYADSDLYSETARSLTEHQRRAWHDTKALIDKVHKVDEFVKGLRS